MKRVIQIVFFANLCAAQAQDASKLKTEIENLKADTCLRHATWSIYVADTKTDSVIAEYNSNLSLTPASIQKTITTYSALKLLGWDYKYSTLLEYDGSIDTSSKTLRGNIYIKGSGDPGLSSEAFKKKSDSLEITEQWATCIYDLGIRKIEGAVIADASVFEDESIPATWVWGDIGNYYGTGTCGLNYKDNKFTLHYKSGRNRGDSTFVTKVEPDIPNLKIENFVLTGLYTSDVYIYGRPYDNFRYAKGIIGMRRPNYEVEGSMPDPALFCAQSLEKSLQALSIGTSLPATTTRLQPSLSKRKTIHTHQSHTIDKIVIETNIQSNNLFAESLLKTIARETKKSGTDQAGIDTVLNFWKSKGLDLKGMFMVDGSGLSRYNAISTQHIGKILNVIAKDDTTLFNKFYHSLPVAGKSGSLGKLCRGTRAENNLHAKSGSMTRVRSYAGYVTDKSNRLLSFAVIVNNYDCPYQLMREKLEKLMIALAEIE